MPVVTSSPRVTALGLAQPEYYADQETLIAAFRRHWQGRHHNVGRLEQLHRATQVRGRHLALPPDRYPEMDTFAKRNDAWIAEATSLGEKAIRRSLDHAGITPREVDHLFFVTISGISVPSVDATLANRLHMRADLKRSPMFGLGCVAGASALARASDYLRAFPNQIAVVLSVELCSLTLQQDDVSMANLVATGLFGDGAAAAVLFGGERETTGPRVLASRSIQYPDTEWVMGWKVVDTGFKVVLSSEVPRLAHEHLRQDVDAFLDSAGLRRSDIRHWICHPGGPKVLEAIESSLGLQREAIQSSWEVLHRLGNLSSATVLYVLDEALRMRPAKRGDYGVLMAMGPGFGSELLLLQW